LSFAIKTWPDWPILQQWYKEAVLRLAFILAIGVLAVSTSGVLDLVVPERCAITESSTGDDGACATTCVRCHCCAQSIEILATKLTAVRLRMVTTPVSPINLILAGAPAEILHVPKTQSL